MPTADFFHGDDMLKIAHFSLPYFRCSEGSRNGFRWRSLLFTWRRQDTTCM